MHMDPNWNRTPSRGFERKPWATSLCLVATIAISSTLAGCSSKPAKPPVIEATLVGSGTIGGRVTLEGTPPEEQKLPLDPVCSQSSEAHGMEGPRFTRTYVTKEGGLGDVLVTLVANESTTLAVSLPSGRPSERHDHHEPS